MDASLTVNELFIGLFNPPDKTGKTLSVVVKDVLTRLTLSLEDLRAQTYDGAANMSGKYTGMLSKSSLNEQLPCIVFHCSTPHCESCRTTHSCSKSVCKQSTSVGSRIRYMVQSIRKVQINCFLILQLSFLLTCHTSH